MAHPDPYTRAFGFTDFSRSNPDEPLPGLQVDTELNAVKIFLDLLLANVKLIQRDDGALGNQVVGLDQLKTEVAFGLNDVADWVTGTQYFQLNGVWFGSVLYRCLVDHISGADFNTDLAAGRWVALVDFAGVLSDAVAAQTAAEAAQTQAELAEAGAETAQSAAELAQATAEAQIPLAQAEVVNAAGQVALAAGHASDAGDSEAAAAQSELDVAAAIAALFDPTVNGNKLLRSDGSTFVPSQLEEAANGDLQFPALVTQLGDSYSFKEGADVRAVLQRITEGLEMPTGRFDFLNGIRTSGLLNLDGSIRFPILNVEYDTHPGEVTTSTSMNAVGGTSVTITKQLPTSRVWVFTAHFGSVTSTANTREIGGEWRIRDMDTLDYVGPTQQCDFRYGDTADNLRAEVPVNCHGQSNADPDLNHNFRMYHRANRSLTSVSTQSLYFLMFEVDHS